MLEEDADLFGDLGTQGVLDSASVLVHHVVVNSEGVMKQPLSQPVATDGFLCARLAEAGQKELAGFETDEVLLCHPKEGGPVRQEFRHVLGAHHTLSGVFLGMPERLQQVVNQFLLDCRENRKLREVAVMQFDTAFRSATDLRIVGDHDNGVSRVV